MCKTLQSKAAFLLTFLIPKFLHVARHRDIMIADIMKSQSELLRIFFPNSKYDIKAEVLYQPISKGGIGLTYLPIRVLVAKLLDFALLSSHSPVTVNTIPDKSITKLLKHCGVQLCQGEDALSLQSITNSENALLISPITQFPAIYDFLVAVKFPFSIVQERLQSAAEKYDLTPTCLTVFCSKLWKSRYLFSFEKNALYRLAFLCIRDKQSKWLDELEESPICAFCDEEFETFTSKIPKTQNCKESLRCLKLV